jgi:hypothetical protein
VKAGESFVRPIGNGLDAMLEPLPSGWILRVLPAAGPRPAHDYAELATPPYHSVSPLLITTDFAFRAQDAIGWNPRSFRFATTAASFARLLAAYAPYADPNAQATPAQAQALGDALAGTSQASFEIVDAHLIPGSADQWKMAAAVASHFTTTAHVIEPSPDGKPSPLGKLIWLRFRIRLQLPPAAQFHAITGLKLLPGNCSIF